MISSNGENIIITEEDSITFILDLLFDYYDTLNYYKIINIEKHPGNYSAYLNKGEEKVAIYFTNIPDSPLWSVEAYVNGPDKSYIHTNIVRVLTRFFSSLELNICIQITTLGGDSWFVYT